MNYTKSLVGTLAAVAVGSFTFAQSSGTSGAGLLGQRYIGAGLFVEDIREIGVDPAYGAALTANLPISANLDLGFAYNYERLEDYGIDLKEHAVAASATAYGSWAGVKPFIDASVGYAWSKVDFMGFDEEDNGGFWSAGVGVEVPVATSTALTGRASYNDLFESGSDGSWAFTGGVSHWFTSQIAGLAAITFNEDENDSVVYQLGAAFRF